MNQIVNSVGKVENELNPAFFRREMFNDKVIELVRSDRKLVVSSPVDGISFDEYVIDLEEVKCVSVKKYYGSIKPGDLKNRSLDAYLERIALHFEFNSGRDPVEIAFYSHIENDGYNREAIEHKAECWKQHLGKIIRGPLEKRA